ncbi:hypothetical protein [Streptomyces sp. NWU339]|uniref:hypothetical protein n=1 Tax=Streptomyces sp. NWU339 TaxID=2185284 RepID=UPI0015E82527|nr:hypothetical protein [Streptomyces sp. NWU339]
MSWFHPPVDEMVDDEPVRQRAVRPRHKARVRVLHPGGKLKGMAQQPPAVVQVAVCLPQCLAEPDTAHRISPGCSRTSKCSWLRPYRCGCAGRRTADGGLTLRVTSEVTNASLSTATAGSVVRQA